MNFEEFNPIPALSAPLPIEDTYTREQGGQEFTYVSNEATIRWLNQHLGMRWSFDITDSTFGVHPEKLVKQKFNKETGKREPYEIVQWIATCQVSMSIWSEDGETVTTRSGWGSGVNFDPDTATKTALAEAVKKASNQFGVALYLWDANVRNRIKALQALDAGNKAPALQVLTEIAVANGIDASDKDAIAEYFGTTRSELRTNNEVLKSVLYSI